MFKKVGSLYQSLKDHILHYKNGLIKVKENAVLAKQLENKSVLNRKEFVLVNQSKKDIRKLVPFGLLVLFLPEAIPLLVAFVPKMIPSPCLTLNQWV